MKPLDAGVSNPSSLPWSYCLRKYAWLWSTSTPSPQSAPGRSVTVPCVSVGAVETVSAPGKPANRLSTLRFSWIDDHDVADLRRGEPAPASASNVNHR